MSMPSFASRSHARAAVITLVLATFIATFGGCGGSSDDGADDPPAATMIGPAGGKVTLLGSAGEAVATVEIPPGALATDTAITIEAGGAGAPPLPVGLTAGGPTVKLTPHGTVFSRPVTLTLPVGTTAPPAGTRHALLKTTAAQAAWAAVDGATVSAATMRAHISSFSFVQVVIEPLPPTDPCDLGTVMGMNITGKVLDPRGRPHIGHVVLRDRALRVGAILAEASANEAGFFLLNADGIVTSAGCDRSYVIEVDSVSSAGVRLFGELDVTSLFPAGGTGQAEEDITATPVVLAEVP
jgi:hypothetical protein